MDGFNFSMYLELKNPGLVWPAQDSTTVSAVATSAWVH